MTTQQRVTLTRAEASVLAELVCDGASNREIADRLGVTEHTVRSHIKRVMRAFDRPCRTAVAVAYLRRQVVVTVTHRRTSP